MRILIIVALLTLMPAFSQADTAKQAEFSEFLQKKAKAEYIAKRLFRANTTSCKILLPEFPAKTHRLADYPKSLQKTAKREQNVQKYFTVYSADINSDTSASKNHLQNGDVLLNGQNKAASEFDTDVLNYRQAGFLRIQRHDEDLIIAQDGPAICPYHLTLHLTQNMQAKAKGVEIFVSLGLIDFAKNDDEVALIIGHELAHLTQGHSNSGIFGVNRNTSLEFQADKIGLDYIVDAGFDPKSAIEFWRRWAGSDDLNALRGKKRQRLERYMALQDYLKTKRFEP